MLFNGTGSDLILYNNESVRYFINSVDNEHGGSSHYANSNGTTETCNDGNDITSDDINATPKTKCTEDSCKGEVISVHSSTVNEHNGRSLDGIPTFKFGESNYLNTDSICSASLIQFKEQYATIVSSDPVKSKKILGGTYILVYPFHLGIDNRNSATIECGNELQFQFDINNNSSKVMDEETNLKIPGGSSTGNVVIGSYSKINVDDFNALDETQYLTDSAIML